MNFAITDDQEMLRRSFARYLEENSFTSGANLTDYVFMLTRTDSDVPRHKGLTMFLVPLKTRGVTVQPVYTFQDERNNITS